MTPPKCRICGMREHNHRCTGGTPAQQVAEQQRVKKLGRVPPSAPEATAPVNLPSGDDGTAPGPKRPIKDALDNYPAVKRRWHDDTDSAGEPTEIADYVRKPARFYAPPGQCVYCDRRRASARISMRAVRERGEA